MERSTEHDLPDHGTELLIEPRLEPSTGVAATLHHASETVTVERGAVAVALATVVVVVVGFLFLSSGDEPAPSRPRLAPLSVPEQETPAVDPAPDPATVQGREAAGADVAARTQWPRLPDDHDPHLVGRPGSGRAVADDLVGLTVVYVNSLGRPTIINLSTGDQREVDIADTRDSAVFLVESGQLVTVTEGDSRLPESGGRAFVFTAVRPGSGGVESATLSGPRLCLDPAGCPETRMLTGTFGNDGDQARSLNVEGVGATAVIADLVGGTVSSTEGRWQILALDGETAFGLKIPTPADNAVVWLIDQ